MTTVSGLAIRWTPSVSFPTKLVERLKCYFYLSLTGALHWKGHNFQWPGVIATKKRKLGVCEFVVETLYHQPIQWCAWWSVNRAPGQSGFNNRVTSDVSLSVPEQWPQFYGDTSHAVGCVTIQTPAISTAFALKKNKTKKKLSNLSMKSVWLKQSCLPLVLCQARSMRNVCSLPFFIKKK